ncbi:hypothetical protein G6F63_016971 [Rhizopus arrhizus]|nr:hypothetical protein G6F63_016971 [Rhizopus arrhizus]
MCSLPIDSRTVSSLTPALASSAASSWRWVVEAGWVASDFASPRLTRRVNSYSASRKRAPASRPPVRTKVSTPETCPRR